MKISIVGGGRVGRVLGLAARRVGYEIGEVISRSKRSAAAAVHFIGDGHASDQITPTVFDADAILICVVDDAIGSNARLLARAYRSRVHRGSNKKPIVLHTSGALSSDILAPLRNFDLAVGSCHPLQTFEDPARAIHRIVTTSFCVEGDKAAVRFARHLVKSLGGKSFVVTTEMKGLYHASAVLASGGVVALLSVCSEFLEASGLSEREGLSVLLPLVQGTVDNISRLGIRAALTGPVRRGDTGTINRNITSIKAHDPQWLDLYRILADRSVDLLNGENSPSPSVLRRVIRGSKKGSKRD